MKVQLQQQSVRLRLGEEELARLLGGQAVSNLTRLGPVAPWSLLLELGETPDARIEQDGATPRIVLPRALIAAYGDRLPCRDGLTFHLEHGHEALKLQFDVDVRDSVRQRGATRRSSNAITTN